jgi:hypothetical protein
LARMTAGRVEDSEVEGEVEREEEEEVEAEPKRVVLLDEAEEEEGETARRIVVGVEGKMTEEEV